MARYYKLARGSESASGGEWPYEVDVCFDAVAHPVSMGAGVCHGSVGGSFTLEEALQPVWNDHFGRAGGWWLRPYLWRMVDGEQVRDQVLAHYRALHRKDPDSYESPLF